MQEEGAKKTFKTHYEIIASNGDKNVYEKDNPPGRLCWWCAHGFKCKPKGLPVHCKEIKNIYTLRGFFCSWQCALAYSNGVEKGFRLYDRSFWIRMLSKKMDGRGVNKPAPPREFLKVFGGTMTIDEFRDSFRWEKAMNQEFLVERPPLLIVVPEEQRLLKKLQGISHIPSLPNEKPAHIKLKEKQGKDRLDKQDKARRYKIKKSADVERNKRLRTLGIKVS